MQVGLSVVLCCFGNQPLLRCSLEIGATDRWRYLLQDEDHSGIDPRLVPGSLSWNSGMLSERFRIVPGLVDSKEIRLTWTERIRFGSLSY